MREPVLLTGDDFYGVLAALRALRRQGHPVWVTVSGAGSYIARSRLAAGVVEVPDPQSQPEEFVHAVAEAARERQVAAVLPGEEAALVALAGRDADMPDGTRLGAPDAARVRRAVDKGEMRELATVAGLSMPPTEIVAPVELRAAAGRVGFPAVLKPARSKGADAGRSLPRLAARVVRSEEELLGRDAAVEQWVLQRYVTGELAAVAGVAWEGRVIGVVHQVAERIAPAICGSSAFARTIPPTPEVDAALARMVSILGWSGIFQAQFIRSVEGDLLIDFNPRIYGSLSLAVAAGADLPSIWLELLLGREPKWRGYRTGVAYRSGEKELMVAFRALRQRHWRLAARTALPHPAAAHAVLSLQDPAPALTSLVKLARRLRSGHFG